MIPVRYIRDWLHGNDHSQNDNWVEIQALNLSGVNLALGCAVTSSLPGSGNNPVLTNGLSLAEEQFYITGPLPPQWVMVDLGSLHTDIQFCCVWHYYADVGGRTYQGTKTEISTDGVNWLPLFDSAVSGVYLELAAGAFLPVTTNYAIANGIGRFRFAFLNSYGYFLPSTAPERSANIVTSSQFTAKTAGGMTYGFDPVEAARVVVLKWPRLRNTEVALLAAFFTDAAQGMVNDFTVYPDLTSAGYPARFASPRLDVVDRCAGSKEVTMTLKQVLHA